MGFGSYNDTDTSVTACCDRCVSRRLRSRKLCGARADGALVMRMCFAGLRLTGALVECDLPVCVAARVGPMIVLRDD